MAKTLDIKVPGIGDFDKVPVIEVMVKPGDRVEKDQGLVTLESDKASMEVPSTAAGTVKEVKVSEGDEVSEGTLIAVLEQDDGKSGEQTQDAGKNGQGDEDGRDKKKDKDKKDKDKDEDEDEDEDNEGENGAKKISTQHRGEGRDDGGAQQAPDSKSSSPSPRPSPASGRGGKSDIECDVCVLGSGPGGYTAAFRAADLGQDTVLVERYKTLGGVCLNVGCIPSKALLHAAEVIAQAAAMGEHGIAFGKPKIDLDKLRQFKDGAVARLTDGLASMAKKRKLRVLTGSGRFVSDREIEVDTADGSKRVRFGKCIIAVGSQAVKLPGLPWSDPRVMDSTDALMLGEIPKKLLVIGGGIIGLEMACVYDALGSEVSVVEMAGQLMPGTDRDLVKPLATRIGKRYKAIHLNTKVSEVKAQKNGLKVSFEGDDAPDTQIFDRVLVAVGRVPNGGKIDADAAGIHVSDRGFIPVDRHMRTSVDHIFAIGDVVGQPLLAHKATHEGKVAAEVAAGEKSAFDARAIPSVAYTDPEIAWTGVTETRAREEGLEYGVGKFPWAASGRAIGIGRTEGFTKLIFDQATHRIIGGGIVGPHAGELIAEVTHAIEMGAEAADIGLTIHPHPTLSETVGMAAEAFEGTITDLYIPKK